MSFSNSDFFLLGIDDENSSRQSLHVFDTAQVLFQLFQFPLHEDNFLLRILVGGAFFKHLFQFFQTVDTGLDGAEIGEHAAQPAFVHVELVAAGSFFLHGILGLLLGAYKENRFALSCHITDESISFFHLLHGLLQIDDVDTVAFGENEPSHLRVPATGLMTEMNACF